MIKNNTELKEIIDKNYPTRVDLVEALMQEFDWRFKSLNNGASWISKKINGHEGLTLSDLMLFELWFKYKAIIEKIQFYEKKQFYENIEVNPEVLHEIITRKNKNEI